VHVLGEDGLGPVAVSGALALLLAYLFGRRVLAGKTLTAEA
jgi:hypothetical protein